MIYEFTTASGNTFSTMESIQGTVVAHNGQGITIRYQSGDVREDFFAFHFRTTPNDTAVLFSPKGSGDPARGRLPRAMVESVLDTAIPVALRA